MKKTRYTEGPWAIDPYDRVIVKEYHKDIAHMDSNNESWRNDARLIIKAPEMAGILKEILKMGADIVSDDDIERYKEIRKRARQIVKYISDDDSHPD